MQIFYSPTFRKRYKKLPIEIRIQAQKKEELFRKHPFAFSLDTHKLHGRMNGLHAFSISDNYRIVFEFISKNIVRFHTIGTHEVYK